MTQAEAPRESSAPPEPANSETLALLVEWQAVAIARKLETASPPKWKSRQRLYLEAISQEWGMRMFPLTPTPGYTPSPSPTREQEDEEEEERGESARVIAKRTQCRRLRRPSSRRHFLRRHNIFINIARSLLRTWLEMGDKSALRAYEPYRTRIALRSEVASMRDIRW